MCIGRRGYDAIVTNFFYAGLPGEQSLHRRIRNRSTITESGFLLSRFREARSFFESHGYMLKLVTCSNDATAVKPELCWRQKDDAAFGQAVPDSLLPALPFFTGGDLAAVRHMLEKHPLGLKLEAILINPLDPKIPSFVLAIFCDVQRDAATHLARWETVDKLLYSESGLNVLSHGCDGDPSHLSAQRTRSKMESAHRFSFAEVPVVTGGMTIVSTATRPDRTVADGITCSMPILHVQDPFHKVLKIRYVESAFLYTSS